MNLLVFCGEKLCVTALSSKRVHFGSVFMMLLEQRFNSVGEFLDGDFIFDVVVFLLVLQSLLSCWITGQITLLCVCVS